MRGGLQGGRVFLKIFWCKLPFNENIDPGHSSLPFFVCTGSLRSFFSDGFSRFTEDKSLSLCLAGPKLESSRRRKMQVADIFSQDMEDEDNENKPRNKKARAGAPPAPDKKSSTAGDKDKDKKDGGGGKEDDKRKHIKSLIEKIPTDRSALFAYSIDWDLVDNQLMEKRIRPWVNKKIAEYIGEPEPTLTDFICAKVLAGSAPKAILEDVQMVLDEEAEVFVVKMWRLLIYEIENKKQKASSTAAAK